MAVSKGLVREDAMRMLAVAAALVGGALASSLPAQGPASPAASFLIFFDWGKPQITSDGRSTLVEVAAAYRESGPEKIMVAGHTDRSGGELYNLRASQRRADAVKAQLVGLGIPEAAIATSAFGETRPIVPTPDGVREAQNRRVEIVFAGKSSGRSSPTQAALMLGDGSRAGSIVLGEGPDGATLVIEAISLPPGIHGLHLHAVGLCSGSAFADAGPHWNPTNAKHGRSNPEGPHLGDLPNLAVGPDGRASAKVAIPAGAVDADGTALVIHAEPDDGRTDPSGNSGARIACAAFRR